MEAESPVRVPSDERRHAKEKGLGDSLDDLGELGRALTKAKEAKVRDDVEKDVRKILESAQAVETSTGEYPRSLQEMVNPRDAAGKRIPGGLSVIPRDPWGNPYLYELRDGEPVAKCLGSDGVPGGEGEAADIELGLTEMQERQKESP